MMSRIWKLKSRMALILGFNVAILLGIEQL